MKHLTPKKYRTYGAMKFLRDLDLVSDADFLDVIHAAKRNHPEWFQNHNFREDILIEIATRRLTFERP